MILKDIKFIEAKIILSAMFIQLPMDAVFPFIGKALYDDKAQKLAQWHRVWTNEEKLFTRMVIIQQNI